MADFIETTLMDGYAGGPHITEVQTCLANQGLYGPGDYVLDSGRKSEAQIITNNSIRIFDAVYVIQGKRDVIAANDYTDVSIDNGSQGMNRNDIIVRRYTKNESSEIEYASYEVIKGTATSGTAVDPDVTHGDIRGGATLHEMPLYRVKLEGLNIVAIEPLFELLVSMSKLKEKVERPEQKVLWRGGNWMDATQTVNLSQRISEQRNGVVLVFSRYSTSSSQSEDNSFSFHFVPKLFPQLNDGTTKNNGCYFTMSYEGAVIANKYLYVFDDKITGYEDNDKANNKYFVLRYVIGV